MNLIKSFCVNHDVLTPGIYTSRIDGDITTYDIRMRKPNHPPFLGNAALHTIEHLFATFARNSAYSDQVVYFGPMGCRTGFYFLVRDLPPQTAIKLIIEIFQKIALYQGEIPGAKAKECGNYKEHDLNGAIWEAKNFLPVIEHWTVENLQYKQ
ncbi:MAG: S-ribosylhomocysteine lyase [Clostridiales bacterium]|nr:S-ribosylhomocysteine lyase [Clostridiales bacterium]MCI1960711.1 S-ribosylhomocysteine lyase [Clostridiales bacterium]MCI2021152.1 S-ribosylhomocysteine lyase [Clostridiales bacterium]MCI2025535.1 S-ribosylhomocysteine lyase [Clostridiales bacterium]